MWALMFWNVMWLIDDGCQLHRVEGVRCFQEIACAQSIQRCAHDSHVTVWQRCGFEAVVVGQLPTNTTSIVTFLLLLCQPWHGFRF